MLKARVLVAACGVVALLVAIQSRPPKPDRPSGAASMHGVAPPMKHQHPSGRAGSAKGAEPAADASQPTLELAGEVELNPSAAP
jgi:hypothetical protein